MRWAYGMLASCLLLGAPACGEQTEMEKVASAYNDVADALRDKDYEQTCERLSKRTRSDLEKAATIQRTKGCGATLKQVVAGVGVDKRGLAEVSASDVRIDGGTRATVNGVRMSQEGGEWRLEGELDFVRPLLSRDAPPG